jgi:hypothetical protein
MELPESEVVEAAEDSESWWSEPEWNEMSEETITSGVSMDIGEPKEGWDEPDMSVSESELSLASIRRKRCRWMVRW